MAQPKIPFLEWQLRIRSCGSAALCSSDTPLDKDVYQPYTNKTGPTKVIVPQVFDENTGKLIERIGSRKDIVFVLQMMPSNLDWFMWENYELYSKMGLWGVLRFYDVLLHCGGKSVFANKMQMNTRKKFKKYVDRMIDTNESFCNVCFETSNFDVIYCGVCSKTICGSCHANWCSVKGMDASCPMCRSKPKQVYINSL